MALRMAIASSHPQNSEALLLVGRALLRAEGCPTEDKLSSSSNFATAKIFLLCGPSKIPKLNFQSL